MTNPELTIEQQIAQTYREYLLAYYRAMFLGWKANRRSYTDVINAKHDAMDNGIPESELKKLADWT